MRLSAAMAAPEGRDATAVKVPWFWERRTPALPDDQTMVSASAE